MCVIPGSLGLYTGFGSQHLFQQSDKRLLYAGDMAQPERQEKMIKHQNAAPAKIEAELAIDE